MQLLETCVFTARVVKLRSIYMTYFLLYKLKPLYNLAKIREKLCLIEC